MPTVYELVDENIIPNCSAAFLRVGRLFKNDLKFTSIRSVARINYQAKEPVKAVSSVMVRDITRMERLG
jgi:hypothetical protein